MEEEGERDEMREKGKWRQLEGERGRQGGRERKEERDEEGGQSYREKGWRGLRGREGEGGESPEGILFLVSSPLPIALITILFLFSVSQFISLLSPACQLLILFHFLCLLSLHFLSESLPLFSFSS